MVDFGSRRAHGCGGGGGGGGVAAVKGGHAPLHDRRNLRGPKTCGAAQLLRARTRGDHGPQLQSRPSRTSSDAFAGLSAQAIQRRCFSSIPTIHPKACAANGRLRPARPTRPLALTGIPAPIPGDLGALAHGKARAILDAGKSAGRQDLRQRRAGRGCESRADCWRMARPSDAFRASGTAMSVSDDAPALDIATSWSPMKGRGVMKLSSGKKTLPGPQTGSYSDAFATGRPAGDVIARGGADEKRWRKR